MTVTIYDVAREASVSMATVSRVVNNNPNVKPATRKKVFEAIERLGYRPNAVARGLASKKTTTVGVVIPDISNANYAEVARGIEDIANMYHYNIILCNADKKKDKEIRVINTLLEKQVDGLLFMGGTVTDEHIQAFKTSSQARTHAHCDDYRPDGGCIDGLTALSRLPSGAFDCRHSRARSTRAYRQLSLCIGH